MAVGAMCCPSCCPRQVVLIYVVVSTGINLASPVIKYDTSFEHKEPATEMITPMLEKDGKWRVSGYYIR